MYNNTPAQAARAFENGVWAVTRARTITAQFVRHRWAQGWVTACHRHVWQRPAESGAVKNERGHARHLEPDMASLC